MVKQYVKKDATRQPRCGVLTPQPRDETTEFLVLASNYLVMKGNMIPERLQKVSEKFR